MLERIRFRGPGTPTLAGVLHLPERPAATGAVLCHGMMSTKDGEKHVGIAERLSERGHVVLRFDFSGRGESEGELSKITFSRQLEECLVAIGEIRRQGVERVALEGSSFGGAVSILAAAQGGIAALATMAAIGRTDLLPGRFAGRSLNLWKRRGLLTFDGHNIGYGLIEDSLRQDVPAAASRILSPWLILHGDQDEVVPVSDAEELHRASGGRAVLEILPGADHQFTRPDQRKHVLDRVAGFLDRGLVGA